jgi:Protein of unknown function (DUF664)
VSQAPAQPPERLDPHWASDERTTLVEFLRYQRDTLERQAFGLTDEQGATAAVSPSILTLTGLIRHMTEVERAWFRRRFVGDGSAPVYFTPERPDGDLEVDAAMSIADAIAAWRAEIELCDQILDGASDLGQVASVPTHSGAYPNMRWILVHMIEEYARHCGHADLIRERIDGATDL